MPVGPLILLAVVGLGAGSLATMGVNRLADAELGLFRPGPRCPDCEATLAVRDLVPVYSFIRLRGRCRHCDGAIGWAYPAVEFVTAALFVMAGWRLPDLVDLLPALILVWVLVVASVTDLYVYLIPNRLIFPALVVSAAVMASLALLDGDPRRLIIAAWAMVLYFLLLFIPFLIRPAAMGMGDVKLALLLGLHLGYGAAGVVHASRMVLIALLLGSLLGVVAGAMLLGLRRAGHDPLPDPLAVEIMTERGESGSAPKAGFPFGPPLAVGCLTVLFFSSTLVPV